MNTIKKMALWAILALMLGACGRNNSKTIGVLFPHNPENNNVIWAYAARYIEKQYGGQAEIMLRAANKDEEAQAKQARELIKAGADIMILAAVNVNSAAALVREAQDNGMKVIAFDRMVPHAEPDFYISYEYEKGGELVAKYALDQKPGGNFALLWGSRDDHNAVLVKQGQEKIIIPASNMDKISVLYKGYVSWYYEQAFRKMERVITHTTDSIDAVLASNDRIAHAAYDALKKHGLEENVFISGMDADLGACQRIAHGKQSCTLYKSIYLQTDATFEVAFSYLENGKMPPSEVTVSNEVAAIPARLLTPVLVDKNNLLETVIKDGLYTKEQVYGTKTAAQP